MTWKTTAVAILALAGALSMASSAQQKPQPATTTTPQPSAPKSLVEHVARGSVVTMSDTSMTVRVRRGKDLTFALNSNTEKIGHIETGNRVTVHFRNEKGQHVATSIQQRSTPQSAAATKSNAK